MTPPSLQPIPEPGPAPRRHTDRPLPDYRHVPGLTPHPIQDPDGHSYDKPEPDLEQALRFPADWRECGSYLYGVDLFNRAYLWEAHEAWEAVWRAAGRHTVPGRFVQGLIQIAAALLKHHTRAERGERILRAEADKKLAAVSGSMDSQGEGVRTYMGVDLARWRADVEAFLEDETRGFPFIVLGGLQTRP